MNNSILIHVFSVAIMLFLFVGCVSLPDVYLVDRHTVMESESSGEWPEMESRFIKQSVSAGPVAYTGTESESSKKNKVNNVLLNAELAAD